MTMTHKLIVGALAALLLAAFGTGCSAEGKAEKALKKYEKVFDMCKEMTAKIPDHRCKKVSSMALEMSLKRTGLDEEKWRKMAVDWAATKGYKEIYIPQKKGT
jgi:hypothetical protein